jgi:UPF0755 protein
MTRMSKSIRIALVSVSTLLVIFIVISISAFAWWKTQTAAPGEISTKKSVVITKGSSGEAIGKKLFEAGVIKSELAFKLYLRLENLSGKLPVGEFEIPQNLSLKDVIAVIQKGPQQVWITIPEGIRREQVPSRFVTGLSLSGAAADSFIDSFLTLSMDEEGYLYPETYLVPKDTTPQGAITLLKNQFKKNFALLVKQTPIEMTDAEIVTLASLIERETLKGDERPMVAGILYNRLRLGMPLQVDATVQYTLANLRCKDSKKCSDWWPTVLRGDYTIASAFNTYKINGLPPHAIANPGKSALEAAARPVANDYIFYLHDKNGVIHYAKTLEEHNQNIAKYIN